MEGRHWWIYCAIAVVFFVLATLLLKKCVETTPYTTCIIIMCLVFGAVGLVWACFKRAEVIGTFGSGVSMITIFAILYLLALLFYFAAIEKAPNPGYARALMTFEVILITILFCVFFKETITWAKLLGIALVVGGSIMLVM